MSLVVTSPIVTMMQSALLQVAHSWNQDVVKLMILTMSEWKRLEANGPCKLGINLNMVTSKTSASVAPTVERTSPCLATKSGQDKLSPTITTRFNFQVSVPTPWPRDLTSTKTSTSTSMSQLLDSTETWAFGPRSSIKETQPTAQSSIVSSTKLETARSTRLHLLIVYSHSPRHHLKTGPSVLTTRNLMVSQPITAFTATTSTKESGGTTWRLLKPRDVPNQASLSRRISEPSMNHHIDTLMPPFQPRSLM